MEANELRIGNYFLNHHKEIDIVTDLTFQKFRCQKIDRDFGIYPIPLTEEWLLKFGFKLNYVGSVTKRFDLSIDNRFDYSFSTAKKDDCGLRFNGTYLNIKYVHQLQNLYFALTGEELEIKEL